MNEIQQIERISERVDEIKRSIERTLISPTMHYIFWLFGLDEL